ncbi:MAG: hypothetical protein ACLTKE_09780 [Coprococcus sp.]
MIKNNGGKDFFGNKVTGTPDIGAFESDVVSLVLTSDVYDIKTAEKQLRSRSSRQQLQISLKI